MMSSEKFKKNKNRKAPAQEDTKKQDRRPKQKR